MSEDELTETDSFISSDSAMDKAIVTKETLEGGWSVEKHVPNEETEVV
jgi:hypothetical protein